MVFQLLERDREKGQHLAQVLQESMDKIGYCNKCRILSESTICSLCQNTARDETLLCIVESPADVVAIEQAGSYKGLYFVLRGYLSPINGIGPADIGIDLLQQRLMQTSIREIILATSSTVEGEATAYYLAELFKDMHILITRIAHGVPMGGELKFLDVGTIAQALQQRHAMGM
jgi:recombination protein RecR